MRATRFISVSADCPPSAARFATSSRESTLLTSVATSAVPNVSYASNCLRQASVSGVLNHKQLLMMHYQEGCSIVRGRGENAYDSCYRKKRSMVTLVHAGRLANEIEATGCAGFVVCWGLADRVKFLATQPKSED